MNEITNIVLRTRRFLLLLYFEISFYMRYVVVRLFEENLLQLRKHTKRLNKLLLPSFIEHFYTPAFLPFVSQETLFLHVLKDIHPT